MILNNVSLILEDSVVSGSLEIVDGVIRSYSDRPTQLPAAIDGENGWVLPG
ncbi:phnM protein, partial [Yersinia pestis PY-12]